jgi:hypothetical protein
VVCVASRRREASGGRSAANR